MTTKEMPSIRRVSEEFEGSLKFDGASQPEESLYAHHIGFTMRTVSETIPPQGMRFHGNDTFGRLTSLPRAFHITKLPCGRWPIELFESLDTKTGIRAIHLEDQKRGVRLLNTDGDEVWFIHKGQGMCNTILGTIGYKAPAYLFVPRSYLYQICPFEET
ncbi:MAG: hypothetical protein Q8R36_03130, partial [bacterium]|nr:hypothetical protein [bacterium]